MLLNDEIPVIGLTLRHDRLIIFGSLYSMSSVISFVTETEGSEKASLTKKELRH